MCGANAGLIAANEVNNKSNAPKASPKDTAKARTAMTMTINVSMLKSSPPLREQGTRQCSVLGLRFNYRAEL
jgi:hypothetical protein